MAKKTTTKEKVAKAKPGLSGQVYTQAGKESGQIDLPQAVFGLPWNGDLVHQVLVSMQSNQRSGTANTQTRGEVRGGGKKPWRQKGTGRARHGSIRSPLWRGGGVTHGPRTEKDYDKKINKKMKTKALFTVISQKQREGEVILLEALKFAKPKAKDAQNVVNSLAKVKGLEKLSYKKGNRTLLALPSADEKTWKSFRNLPGVAVEEARNLNPELILNYQYLVLANPELLLPILEARAKAK